MKKLHVGVLAVALLFGAAVAAQAAQLTIVGTGSGVAILEAIAVDFMKVHPEHAVSIPKSIGSGGGIKAVGREEYQLGRVARKIKQKEEHYGLSYMPVAKMPIVFFTNKNVGVENLTVQQVLDIYSGKITKWSEVGGPDARVRVVRREDGDSSLSVLRELFPGFANIVITERSKTVYSDPETLDIVEKKDNTIAFGTYGNASNRQVRVLNIKGASPTDAEYPYFGTLALIFLEKNKKGAVADFLQFATSERASNAIKRAGGAPF